VVISHGMLYPGPLNRWQTLFLFVSSCIRLAHSKDFHMPGLMHAGPVTTTECHACATVTPPIHRAAMAVPSPAATVAPHVTPAPTPAPAPHVTPAPTPATAPKESGPGLTFVAAPTAPPPSTKAYDADKIFRNSPPPPANTPKVNIPLIAGLAGGGAVVVGGAVAGIVAAVQANKHKKEEMEEKMKRTILSTTFLGTFPPPPSVRTVLALPIGPGETKIEVADQSGFAIGDIIRIGTEINEIKGFSSIILDHPVGQSFAANTPVELVSAASGSLQSATSAPTLNIDEVLGGGNVQLLATTSNIFRRENNETDGDNGSYGVAMLIAGLLFCAAAICMVSLIMFCLSSRKLRAASSRNDEEDYEQVDDEEEEEEDEESEEENYSNRVAAPAMHIDPLAETQYAVISKPQQPPTMITPPMTSPQVGVSFGVPPSGGFV